MPILPWVGDLRDAVHRYSNQGSSISQSRNRRHEQIENVLFQSDPICTPIYLESKGTLLENGGRKSMQVLWATVKNMKRVPSQSRRWKKHSHRRGGGSYLNNLWSTDFEPLQKATSADGVIYYFCFTLGDNLWNSQRLIVFNTVTQGLNRLPACWWWMERLEGRKRSFLITN